MIHPVDSLGRSMIFQGEISTLCYCSAEIRVQSLTNVLITSVMSDVLQFSFKKGNSLLYTFDKAEVFRKNL